MKNNEIKEIVKKVLSEESFGEEISATQHDVTIKAYGNSAHVPIFKRWLGHKVDIIIKKEKDEEYLKEIKKEGGKGS